MTTAHVVMLAFALLSAACSAKAMGPPEIAVDRTTCSHCGMFVSEPIYAAAYQVRGQNPRTFDDIGCLLDALRHESEPPAAVWVHDAAGRGWIDAGEAVFLLTAHVRTPMSGGVLAFADADAAGRAASTHRGEVVRSFEALVARNGEAR